MQSCTTRTTIDRLWINSSPNILEADKEGFLRDETSLVQMIGRATRHVNGKVILYAHTVTGSMIRAIDATRRRRRRQQEHNGQQGIIITTTNPCE